MACSRWAWAACSSWPSSVLSRAASVRARQAWLSLRLSPAERVSPGPRPRLTRRMHSAACLGEGSTHATRVLRKRSFQQEDMNALLLYSASSVTSGHPKCFTILPHNHPFTQLVRVRRLAQGHLHPQLGGAGDPTPATLRLPADPLYLLSYCHPTTRPQGDSKMQSEA